MILKKWLFLKIFDSDHAGEKLYLKCMGQLRQINRERVINNNMLKENVAINNINNIDAIMKIKFSLEELRDSYINMIWKDETFPLIRFTRNGKN